MEPRGFVSDLRDLLSIDARDIETSHHGPWNYDNDSNVCLGIHLRRLAKKDNKLKASVFHAWFLETVENRFENRCISIGGFENRLF